MWPSPFQGKAASPPVVARPLNIQEFISFVHVDIFWLFLVRSPSLQMPMSHPRDGGALRLEVQCVVQFSLLGLIQGQVSVCHCWKALTNKVAAMAEPFWSPLGIEPPRLSEAETKFQAQQTLYLANTALNFQIFRKFSDFWKIFRFSEDFQIFGKFRFSKNVQIFRLQLHR